MQVRNKLNGNVTSVPTNDNGIRALIRLGILEVIDNTPAPGEWVRTQNGAMQPAPEPPATPRWYVGTMSAGSTDNLGRQGDEVKIPIVVFEVGTTIFERFCGDPQILIDGQAFGRRTVPADIIAAYEKAHAAYYKTSTKELFKAVVKAVVKG